MAGQIVTKQKCVRLADYCDRYRCESDLDDLVAEKMAAVHQAAKCPHSSDLFVSYVEETYLPFVLRAKKPSTYAGYRSCFERYIKPWTGDYALRDFTVAVVAQLLKDIARTYKVNRDTVTKVRSLLSGIFTYAMSEGHFPARSRADNPASRARIPDCAVEPERTVAATREQVSAILAALKGLPLERAAAGIVALTGVRPGEARGLRWEEWDRAKDHIHVKRAVWHKIVGTTKTEQSERYVAVTDELRDSLLDLWNARQCPIAGYILSGPRKGQPANLDNMAKRSIRDALNVCATCKRPESAKHEGHEYERDAILPTWPEWYALRRFLGTQVRMQADSETSSKALGNSKEVFDKHYNKPTEVLPDVRKAVKSAVSGLIS